MLLPMTDESLALARELLGRGETVAFPTETVYGLGANALSAAAVERIYALKGRPRYNPLIVHVPDLQAAQRLSRDWPPLGTALAERFWPGPLTLVVPRGDSVPAIVSAGLKTVALRVPAHPQALRLLHHCQLPLAAPSANRSEQVSPTTAEHVRRGLPGVPLILDGGPCRLGIESTVVDLTTTPPRLLRPGALSLRLLREVLPDLELPQESESPDTRLAADIPRSPGMLARHYAPRARLVLLPKAGMRQALLSLPPPRGLLTYLGRSETAELQEHCVVVEKLAADAAGYAADLYAALHRLDDHEVKSIAVVPPPAAGDADTDDGWVAVHDRLGRASKEPAP